MRPTIVTALAALLCAYVHLEAQQISSPTQYQQQSFDVLRYEAYLKIGEPSSRYIEGVCSVIVKWKTTSDQPVLLINLRELDIDSIWSGTKLLTYTLHGDRTMDTMHYAIDIDQSVYEGQLDTVTIAYHGVMMNEGGAQAWGGVTYADSVLYALGVGFSNPSVSATQYWLPCYDHPSDKAQAHLTFNVPVDYTVASVGHLLWTQVANDGLTKNFGWQENHECATYLLTFAVGRFSLLELDAIESDVPIHIYTRPRDASASARSYKLVPHMVQELERLYGTYPYDKVGFVNTSKGAMEHQTMISFPVSLVTLRDTVNTTAAHELAHQWFGDLVTPLDFRHAWLTESFATYSEAAWIEHLKGYDKYLEALAASARNYITNVSRDEGVFSLYDFPREAPSSNYPVTIYRKGQNVVAMARTLSNTVVFYTVLQNYLQGYQFGTATTEDMKFMLNGALGSFTDAFFNEWIYGKGWPQLEVETIPRSDYYTMKITQVQQSSHPDWPIFTTLPLNMTYRDPGTLALVDTVIIMGGASISIDVASLNEFTVDGGTKSRALFEVVKTTSVNEESQQTPTILITPNPAQDNATLHLRGAVLPYNCTITNLNGTTVAEYTNVDSENFTIDTHALAPGIYAVSVHSSAFAVQRTLLTINY